MVPMLLGKSLIFGNHELRFGNSPKVGRNIFFKCKILEDIVCRRDTMKDLAAKELAYLRIYVLFSHSRINIREANKSFRTEFSYRMLAHRANIREYHCEWNYR